MSDLVQGYAITGADEVARNLASVANQIQTLTTRQQANAGASRSMAQAGAQANQSFAQMVQQGQQVTQRVQGMAAAVQGLVGQLGSSNRSAGLVASVAGTTAQFAAMGSTLGPAGAVIGGLIGLGTAISGVITRQTDLASRTADATQALRDQAGAAIEARRALNALNNVNAALAGGTLAPAMLADMTDAEVRAEAERRRMGVNSLERMGSENALLGRRLADGSLDERSARNLTGGAEALAALGGASSVAALRDQIAALEAESRRREEAAGAASRERTAGTLSGLDASAARREAEAERERNRRRSGGPRRRPEADESLSSLNAETEGDLFGLSGFNMESFLSEDAAATLAENTRAAEEAATAIEMIRDAESEAIDRSNEKAREQLEIQRELADAARESAEAFGTGYVNSLDAVIAAYHEANEAARAAGTGVISTQRLMERSVTATGNSIAETIGGTMVGAFEKAMGAWLDGSQTFVEAAESMVKGVLKALVIESVVQAITETARGLAKVASSYGADPSAYAHFAAAAMWAGVGVAAGAVGAGIGAFGGGGAGAGAGGGPTSRELAGDRGGGDRGGDTYYIEINPGGFITNDDIEAGLVNGLNRAGRNGRQIDSRAVRQ